MRIASSVAPSAPTVSAYDSSAPSWNAASLAFCTTMRTRASATAPSDEDDAAAAAALEPLPPLSYVGSYAPCGKRSARTPAAATTAERRDELERERRRLARATLPAE